MQGAGARPARGTNEADPSPREIVEALIDKALTGLRSERARATASNVPLITPNELRRAFGIEVPR